MPLVVGIDEAGYGPLLGPLVVAASVWQATPSAARENCWERLSDVVCRKRGRNESRLAINDSKQVYDRKKGLAALERPVLACASAAGLPTDTAGSFLRAVCETELDRDLPPWYQNLDQRLPLDPVRAAFAGIAERLQSCMVERELRCCNLLAELIPASVFNQRVAQTRNKAAVLIEQVLRLMQRAARQTGTQDLHFYVDRLGGRQDYRGLLLSAFPERHLHVQEVTDECSRYRLATQHSDWLIEFRVDADQHFLPVALASMLAKYVREMLMERFNAFWSQLLPKLRPTAGYYRDALRFLTDIQPVLHQAGLPREQFVRSR